MIIITVLHHHAPHNTPHHKIYTAPFHPIQHYTIAPICNFGGLVWLRNLLTLCAVSLNSIGEGKRMGSQAGVTRRAIAWLMNHRDSRLGGRWCCEERL